jgi:hypothetical protein
MLSLVIVRQRLGPRQRVVWNKPKPTTAPLKVIPSAPASPTCEQPALCRQRHPRGATDERRPRPVRFPYEDTSLPRRRVPAELGTAHPIGADPDLPRPPLLVHGGFDSTKVELFFTCGAAAVRRGYHVPAFAGPGKGSTLRDQKLLYRADWDAVATPALDCSTEGN